MKKVLIVETNVEKYGDSYEATGLWLGEAAEFVDELNKAGVQYDFVSPKGGYVPIDPRSMKYVDESIMNESCRLFCYILYRWSWSDVGFLSFRGDRAFSK